MADLLMTPVVTLGYRHRGVAIAMDGAEMERRSLLAAMLADTENGDGGLLGVFSVGSGR